MGLGPRHISPVLAQPHSLKANQKVNAKLLSDYPDADTSYEMPVSHHMQVPLSSQGYSSARWDCRYIGRHSRREFCGISSAPYLTQARVVQDTPSGDALTKTIRYANPR